MCVYVCACMYMYIYMCTVETELEKKSLPHLTKNEHLRSVTRKLVMVERPQFHHTGPPQPSGGSSPALGTSGRPEGGIASAFPEIRRYLVDVL